MFLIGDFMSPDVAPGYPESPYSNGKSTVFVGDLPMNSSDLIPVSWSIYQELMWTLLGGGTLSLRLNQVRGWIWVGSTRSGDSLAASVVCRTPSIVRQPTGTNSPNRATSSHKCPNPPGEAGLKHLGSRKVKVERACPCLPIQIFTMQIPFLGPVLNVHPHYRSRNMF